MAYDRVRVRRESQTNRPVARPAPPSAPPAAGRRFHRLQRLTDAPTGAVMQGRFRMDNTGALDYDGSDIGPNSADPDVESFLDSLEDDAGYSTAQLDKVKALIEAGPLYVFDGLTHLTNYLTSPGLFPPKLEHDDEGAMMLDDVSRDFGTTFKGKGIAFSGSRVYSVAHSEGAKSVWAMQNSATGNIPKGNQQVVKNWAPPDLKLPITFPSNTKRDTDKFGLKRPTVMSANAHAEVNEIVQHAYRALSALHMSPHDVGLMFGSDIQHCAECYWAAHAMWKKGNKKPFNATGCGNKLFDRWREPWSGFYADYGDNPFRKSDGTFRTGFAKGAIPATALNAAVSGSLGNIYT
jgi:hypothetical protein